MRATEVMDELNLNSRWMTALAGARRPVFLALPVLLTVLALSVPTPQAQTVYGKDDSVTVEISTALREMFWRVRANDNSVFYENEFPHLRETMNLDQYLQGVRFMRPRAPNSDSTIGLLVDSVTVFGDTARAHVTLTLRSPGSEDTHDRASVQWLYRHRGAWIRPLSTTPESNDEYYRRIQRYEEDADR
ncbi:MAG: hypothetical protein ACE5GA_10140 [Candidatus Zixiibacteriota bacterium]